MGDAARRFLLCWEKEGDCVKNPCNGCDKRNPFCHISGNCLQEPSYHEWRDTVTAAKNAVRKSNIVTDFLAKNVHRMRKRKNVREE